MLYDLLYDEGRDKFENFTFSGNTWSAPSLEAPEKIRELLDSFHLIGRKIKKACFIISRIINLLSIFLRGIQNVCNLFYP